MEWVYLDTETHPIASGRLAPKLVCVHIATGGGEVGIHLASDPATRDIVEKALKGFRVCGHNIAYDMAVIAAFWPDLMPAVWAAYDEGRVFDTMLCAQMEDIAMGRLTRKKGHYSLQSLASRYAKLDLTKGNDSWQLRYAELENIPVKDWPAEAVEYAVNDVRATRTVVIALIFSSDGGYATVPTFDVQVRAAFALHLASCWGMRCDEAAVAALEDRLDEVEATQAGKLKEIGLLRDNGTRDDAAIRALAEKAGVTKRTSKGKVSTSAAALQDVNDEGLVSLSKRQAAAKIRTTYLPVLKRGVREPLHCRYGLVESGRTSCSSPNIQNLPRDGGVRECFVPRKGFVFVAADFHVVELICLSQVLIEWYGLDACEMPKALLRGLDLHLVTASHILGWSYEETEQAYRAGDATAKGARQLAKGLNFGIPGGLGAAKLRQLLRGYGHEVSEERAVSLKKKWLQLYPEMRLYFQKIGVLTRVFGDDEVIVKHPVTGFVRGGLDYCSTANHYFQHLAAYGAKIALYSVQRACFAPTGPLAGSRMVAFVHDEIILEVPERNVDEAARELVGIMCAEFMQACPDVPVHAEALAMRKWCKDAKPKHDSRGRLIPWG